jgi:uncharacterized protein (TIGR02145 family)
MILKNKIGHHPPMVIFLLSIFLFFSESCNKKPEIVKDIDGNVYRTITIGTQVWMAENLRVTKFRNGDPIPEVKNDSVWRTLTASAYCNYNNDTAHLKIYGRLYNWFSIRDSRNIAPEGWHIPTNTELQTLLDYLGGDNVAGGKMKESGTTHWISPNTGATNESGFTALPGGYRFITDSAHIITGGTFHTLGSNGYWWTTTASFQMYSWSKFVHLHFADVIRDHTNKTFGLSIRCIKDQ